MFLQKNRSSSVYERICPIITSGTSKLSEIAEKAGITAANASASLHSLEETDVVKRDEPSAVTGKTRMEDFGSSSIIPVQILLSALLLRGKGEVCILFCSYNRIPRLCI